MEKPLLEIKPIRNIARFKDIVGILFKYGFDGLVEKLGLPGSYLIKKFTKIERGLTIWERIRFALEDLGPTYVKFGQILSMRPDLIPPGLIHELRKLRESVHHEDFDAIREMVEESLKIRLDDVFESFEELPIAAGSLAQVHRAILKKEKKEVAVKVQRPHIKRIIKSDLDILQTIAKMVHDRVETLQPYNIPGIVQEIERHLSREIDFINEATNIQIFKQNFALVTDVHAPDIYIEYTCPTVLTMEFIDGEKIEDIGGEERKERLARRGVEIVLKQILIDGFFHSDPHPGNIRILEGDVICFLDWGMVGRLTTEMRYLLVDFIKALAYRNGKKLLKTLISMSASVPPLLDEAALQTETLFLMDRLHSRLNKTVNVGRFLTELVNLLRQHRVELRPDYVFMIKALVAIEGTGRELWADFDAINELKPLITKVTFLRMNPFAAEAMFLGKLAESLKLIVNLPEKVESLIKHIEGGKLTLEVHHRGLEGTNWTLHVVGNRIAFGLIIAALIIGSSMVITSGIGPFLFGYPIFGIAGYVFSGVLGIWLVIHMILRRNL